MSDGKSREFRPPLYHAESRSEGSRHNVSTAQQATEQKGWDAYRKWLSSVSGKAPSDRAPLDASIYSWKGYHNWADRIRQAWKAEDN